MFQLTDIKKYFFTKKQDQSLENIGIYPGALILCKKTKKLKDYEIGIFTFDNTAVMRQIIHKNKTTVQLIPYSNDNTFEILEMQLDQINIIAKVEKVILDFNNKAVLQQHYEQRLK